MAEKKDVEFLQQTAQNQAELEDTMDHQADSKQEVSNLVSFVSSS